MPDFRLPHHLPQRREGPYDPRHLPRQRRGVTPQMIGRYPDYDVLATADTWDETTRRAVLARLDRPGPLRFFGAEDEPTLRALCDLVTEQHDEPRIPVAEMVDAKYADGKLDGYQYADMPDDRETWHLVLRGLDDTARRRFGGRRFHEIDLESRRGIMDELAQGTLQGDAWDRLNVKRAFSVIMRAAVSEFYSHPWAWNEIGFGGPAYPRGYMRFGSATREPFERPEALNVDAERDVEAQEA